MIANRSVLGEYHRLFPFIKKRSKKFSNYMRMRVSTFKYILSKIKYDLRKNWCNFHKYPIRPEEQLVITIRFLIIGCSYSDLGHSFCMSKSQVGKIIGQVLASLWKRLHPLHLPRPTKDILMASAQQYFLQWDLPHCIGSLDVCHIEIKKPPHSGSKYYNYKKFFSTPLQALVDADGKFISIDVGGYGSQHDSTTFRCSSLYKNFKAGKLNFPEDDGRYGLEVNTPYFIIGDGAYALSRNLIKPYPGHELTSMQKMFNKRISRARINVERAFGKLKKKWKIFKQPIEQKLSKTKLIVTVACVLTNTIIDLETLGVDVNPRQPAIVHRVVGNDVFTGNSQVVRNKLMTYMINNPI